MAFRRIRGLSSPDDKDTVPDFGFHHHFDDVQLCVMCAEKWNWTPNQTLAQPFKILLDMFRYINKRDEDDDEVIPPEYYYEDQHEDGGAKRTVL